MEFAEVVADALVSVRERRPWVLSRECVDPQTVQVDDHMVEESDEPHSRVVDLVRAMELDADVPLFVDMCVIAMREGALEQPYFWMRITIRESTRDFYTNAEQVLLPRPTTNARGPDEHRGPEHRISDEAPGRLPVEQRPDVLGARHGRRRYERTG
jgi:hypothetical protein